MKVLITGASGLVGNIAFNEFSKDAWYTVFGTHFVQRVKNLIYLDVQNKNEVSNIIMNLKPDIIIHAAANPNVEHCEDHPQETRQVNIEGSRNLIESARAIGAKFVFFSSDYVFDGINGPYSEEDVPNPINEYGLQKLAVENIIENSLTDYLIIRITVVYGWELRGKNFVMRMIENLNSGHPMKVPYDQIGSPTYSNNMVQVVKELIESNKVGVYHVAGSDLMDRYTFARNVADVFELDENLLLPVTTDELGQRAKRPLRAGMKITKVQKDVSIHLMSVREGLEEMKKNQLD